MPGFAGKVFHNNPNRPIVDIPDNQVRGFGIFDSVASRNALDATIQTDGFVAVTDTADGYKAYMFTGSSWSTEADWTEIGSSTTDTNITDNLTFDANATSVLAGHNFTIESTSGNTLAYFNGTDARVGIGTSTPSDLFHVAGDVKVDGVLKLDLQGAAPAAVAGGLYADNANQLFFGVAD